VEGVGSDIDGEWAFSPLPIVSSIGDDSSAKVKEESIQTMDNNQNYAVSKLASFISPNGFIYS
jgi:hypothetical protein